MIHRGGRLRVPIAPRLTAIGGDDAALIGDDEKNLRVVRIHPHALVVVATRCAADGGPRDTGILGPPHHGARAVDDVLVLGIDGDCRQVTAADAAEWARVHHRWCGVRWAVERKLPVFARVAADVHVHGAGDGIGLRHRGDGRVNDLRVARRNRQVGLDGGRQAIGERLPCGAAVDGLEDAVAAGAKALALDEALLLLPECRVNDIRIRWIDADVVSAGVLVLVEHLLERCAAVGRPKYPALGVRTIRMTERRNEEPIRIGGVDVDVADHLRIVQTEVRPRLAGVGGLVHAVALREVGTDDARPTADIDDVGITRRHGDRTDGAGGLVVEEGEPRGPVVGGAPHAAVVESYIEYVRLTRHTGRRSRSACSCRTNLTPAHVGRGVNSLGVSRDVREEDDSCEQQAMGRAHGFRMFGMLSSELSQSRSQMGRTLGG